MTPESIEDDEDLRRASTPASAWLDGEQILNLMPDAVLGLDLDRRIACWNRAAEVNYGFSAQEALGRDPVDLLGTSFPIPLAEVLETLADTGRWQGILLIHTRNGIELTVESCWTVAYDEQGKVKGSIGVDRDVSLRRREEAEHDQREVLAERERLRGRMRRAERLESVGQLAGGVAHDFNNLLAIIINYGALVTAQLEAECAGGDERWAPLLQDLGEIDKAASRAAALTHQLLAFSRQDVHAPAPIDLNEAIEGVEALLRRTIGEHVQLQTNLAEGLHTIRADVAQLEHALVNLALNGRDAMPQGGQLTISTANVEVDADYASLRPGLEAGSYVRLQVSDTGIGMAAEVVDHAFDPFFTTKPVGEGTGLGLATVYGIVTQAGGHTHIYSAPGVGTSFVAVFPAIETPSSPPRHQPAAIPAEATILVVEDELALRVVTRRILEGAGYRVLSAGNGVEALAVAAGDESVDLLLSDVIMPEMLGDELARRLRELKPSIRVLFMSGFAQPVLGDAMQIGLVEMIEKPFTGPALLGRVASALSSG